MIFSGPAPLVLTTLHFTLDGDFTVGASGAEDEVASSSLRVQLNGGLCWDGDEFTFDGIRAFRSSDPANGTPIVEYTSSSGVLDDRPLDILNEFSVGPFNVPTGIPVQIEFLLNATNGSGVSGGSATSNGDFLLALGRETDGLVFDLPSGYSADSVALSIENSQAVPEPAFPLAATFGFLGLLYLRRSASAPC